MAGETCNTYLKRRRPQHMLAGETEPPLGGTVNVSPQQWPPQGVQQHLSTGIVSARGILPPTCHPLRAHYKGSTPWLRSGSWLQAGKTDLSLLSHPNTVEPRLPRPCETQGQSLDIWGGLSPHTTVEPLLSQSPETQGQSLDIWGGLSPLNTVEPLLSRYPEETRSELNIWGD